MWILVVFLVLTSVETFLIWDKWSTILDYRDLSSNAASYLKLHSNKYFNLFLKGVMYLAAGFKKVLIIPIVILFIINIIISLILGGILNLIF